MPTLRVAVNLPTESPLKEESIHFGKEYVLQS